MIRNVRDSMTDIAACVLTGVVIVAVLNLCLLLSGCNYVMERLI